MSSKRNSRSSANREYDRDNVDNWTIAQLREALKEKGIVVPASLSKTILKSLYKENSQTLVSSATPNVTPPTQQARNRSRSPVDRQSTNPDNIGISECLKTLTSTMTAFTETMKGMTRGNPVTTGTSAEKSSGEWPTLTEAYSNSASASVTGTYDFSFGLDRVRHLAAQNSNGIPANMLVNIDIVSDNIKKRIVDGRNVNLASLLIPDFEPASKDQKEDSRLKKRLSIEQFRVAFGKYRRIMVKKWPHRQQELEAYESDLARMHAFYGDKFYDYHLAFASKAAEAIKLNIPIDWSRRDTELFQLILGGTRARQCLYCSSTLHESDFCDQSYRPNLAQKNRFQQSAPNTRSPGSSKDLDKYGRRISFHQGVEVCNNFNSSSGCTQRSCTRVHRCSNCMSQSHARLTCQNLTKKKVETTQRNMKDNSA